MKSVLLVVIIDKYLNYFKTIEFTGKSRYIFLIGFTMSAIAIAKQQIKYLWVF